MNNNDDFLSKVLRLRTCCLIAAFKMEREMEKDWKPIEPGDMVEIRPPIKYESK